jgi:dienelactone hydrolase
MNICPDTDNYTRILAGEIKRELSFDACNGMPFVQWQQKLRAKITDMLGINEISKRAPASLVHKVLSVEQLDGFTREKILLTTERGVEIPFYLLKPKGAAGELPLIITPHGHSPNGPENYAGIYLSEQEKQHTLEGERDIALQAVKRGYIAISPMMRGFGVSKLQEDIEAGEGWSDRKLQMRAMMFGRTLIGERVWDMMKIIDYALQRGDVNPDKIAISGNSGGGTVSLFAAACEQRISISVPSCYFCTFEDSIGSIFHCECNYIPGIMRVAEMYDVAGLICPRPVLMIAGEQDPIFPIKGVRYAFSHLQKIYEKGGAAKNCELFVGTGGHRYYKEYVWDFIAKHW